MKKLFLLAIILVAPVLAFCQACSIVFLDSKGSPVPSVSVYDLEEDTYFISTDRGTVNIPSSSGRLRASHVQYRDTLLQCSAGQSMTVVLSDRIVELSAIQVVGFTRAKKMYYTLPKPKGGRKFQPGKPKGQWATLVPFQPDTSLMYKLESLSFFVGNVKALQAEKTLQIQIKLFFYDSISKEVVHLHNEPILIPLAKLKSKTTVSLAGAPIASGSRMNQIFFSLAIQQPIFKTVQLRGYYFVPEGKKCYSKFFRLSTDDITIVNDIRDSKKCWTSVVSPSGMRFVQTYQEVPNLEFTFQTYKK